MKRLVAKFKRLFRIFEEPANPLASDAAPTAAITGFDIGGIKIELSESKAGEL